MIAADIDQSRAADRRTMVDCQIRPFDVTDAAVLAAFLDVAREDFVADGLAAIAYADRALPARGAPDRMLMAPMALARLLQGADIKAGDRVLDVAGGSFYTAALVSHLAAKVTALDSVDRPEGRAALGAAKVDCVTGPLTAGWAVGAPYNVIIVNGGLAQRPDALLAQLAEGGRLVACDLMARAPRLVRFERSGAVFGCRAICEGSAPELSDFRKAPGFVF